MSGFRVARLVVAALAGVVTSLFGVGIAHAAPLVSPPGVTSVLPTVTTTPPSLPVAMPSPGSGDIAGVSLAPSSPVPRADPHAPTAGDDGGSPTGDRCAQGTDSATNAGAPIASSCPITPTEAGGVVGSLCLDVAAAPSCGRAASVTTTTSLPSPAPTDAAGSPGPGSAATGRGTAERPPDPAATLSAAITSAPAAHRSGGTLPFTGGAIAGLLALGAALTAAGAALARIGRRRCA